MPIQLSHIPPWQVSLNHIAGQIRDKLALVIPSCSSYTSLAWL
jgi:hypothetical protein